MLAADAVCYGISRIQAPQLVFLCYTLRPAVDFTWIFSRADLVHLR